MSTDLITILFGVFALVTCGWLVFLTLKYRAILKKAEMLFSTEKQGNVSKVIEEYLANVKSVEDHCFDLDKETKRIRKMAEAGLQRVGYIRYNPFGNVGGDQSFSLCLMDKNESGFVITSIHSREGTRVYFKPLDKAKSDYNLSEEEKKAIEIAQKSNK